MILLQLQEVYFIRMKVTLRLMKWSKSLTKIDLMRFVSVIFNFGVVPSKLPNTLPNSLANFVLFSKKSWKRWSMIRFWHSEVYNNKFYLVPDSPRISKEWFRFWTRDSLIGKEIEISCTQPRISETCIHQHILFFLIHSYLNRYFKATSH